MRFYTKRCRNGHRTQEQATALADAVEAAGVKGSTPEQRLRLDRLRTAVSDRVEILDGANTLEPLTVSERDVDFIVAALNAADRREQLCRV